MGGRGRASPDLSPDVICMSMTHLHTSSSATWRRRLARVSNLLGRAFRADYLSFPAFIFLTIKATHLVFLKQQQESIGFLESSFTARDVVTGFLCVVFFCCGVE